MVDVLAVKCLSDTKFRPPGSLGIERLNYAGQHTPNKSYMEVYRTQGPLVFFYEKQTLLAGDCCDGSELITSYRLQVCRYGTTVHMRDMGTCKQHMGTTCAR